MISEPDSNRPERNDRPERSDRAERSERPERGERRERPRRATALTVVVGDRGIEAALRIFKKLVLKEGLLKDMKRREHYEKPGDRKRRKRREAIRRRRRQAARTRGRFGTNDRE